MLTACQNCIHNEGVVETTESICQTLDDNDGSYKGDIINDESMAKEYANLIMANTLQKNIKDYKVVDVSFDNNDLWIVNYCMDEQTLGGDISIMISRKDGKITKILFGE